MNLSKEDHFDCLLSLMEHDTDMGTDRGRGHNTVMTEDDAVVVGKVQEGLEFLLIQIRAVSKRIEKTCLMRMRKRI